MNPQEKKVPALGFFKAMIFLVILVPLGLTIGLPLIIHYAEYDELRDIPDKTASEAFFWLGLGCVLWILLWALFINGFIGSQFRKKRKLEKLMLNGRHQKGTVLTKQVIRQMREGDLVLLKVQFKNFSDALVETNLDAVDSEPHLNRFAAGKSIGLILNPETYSPPVIVDGKGFQWNRKVMGIIVFILLLLLILGPAILVYSYQRESAGYGWRYLSFGHPFVLIPFIGVIELIFILLFTGIGSAKKTSRLLLYGKSATATIIKTERTGLSINDQPQVLFTIEFDGPRGQPVQASFKKIVDLLKIPEIIPGKTISILYDKEHPQIIEPIE
jgi:hypothetical protein